MNRCLRRLLAALVPIFFAPYGSASEPTEVYLPTNAPVTLRFSAFNPARERIDEQWFLKNITAGLEARSHQAFRSDGLATEELTGLRTRLDQAQSQIVFQYVHLNRNRKGDEWGETLTLPVSYRMERDSDFLIIRLQPPRVANLSVRTTHLFFVPTPKLGTIKDLLDDFSAIVGHAQSLTLHYSFLFRGAESASSNPAAVIENFDRLLGRYGYGKHEERLFDLTRDDVFSYRAGQGSLPLKVATVPYRNGSRIVYEMWLPLELRADGTVKGYELAPTLEADIRFVLDDKPALERNSGLDNSNDRSKVHNR